MPLRVARCAAASAPPCCSAPVHPLEPVEAGLASPRACNLRRAGAWLLAVLLPLCCLLRQRSACV